MRWCASIPTPTCRPTSPRTTTRSRPRGGSIPQAASYTDIYDRYGLLGPRSLFGHCIHLDEPELERLSATRSIAAFCPTSNLFIGSGLFDLAMLRDPGARCG